MHSDVFHPKCSRYGRLCVTKAQLVSYTGIIINLQCSLSFYKYIGKYDCFTWLVNELWVRTFRKANKQFLIQPRSHWIQSPVSQALKRSHAADHWTRAQNLNAVEILSGKMMKVIKETLGVKLHTTYKYIFRRWTSVICNVLQRTILLCFQICRIQCFRKSASNHEIHVGLISQ